MTSTPPPVVGIDVGGTRIKSGVLIDGRLGGRLVDVTEVPTPGDVDGQVAVTAARARELAERHGADRVGLVVPGVVDAERGIAVHSENLGWRNVPLRDQVSQACDLPVTFGHDVRAGALAEARLGAAAGDRDVAFLALGTGIAAGLVLDGELFDRDRANGEIGHVDVGHGEKCVCGQTGCLEAIASASAIARHYETLTGRTATAKDVADLVRDGHRDAVAVWNDAVEALAVSISWLASVLAPDVVVVGGGLAKSGDLLLVPLRQRLEDRLTFQHRPELRPAALGDLAGCVGAALLALDDTRAP